MADILVGPLVRATDATRVTIWVECSQPSIVTLTACPLDTASFDQQPVTVSIRTVTVGGRYYAAPQLKGLRPATWYRYQISTSEQSQTEQYQSVPFQYVRTLDDPSIVEASLQSTTTALRLAYGSCRHLDQPEMDVLSAYADWLLQHMKERETIWPHLLLLLGDQIYADQPSPALVAQYPQLREGASTFEEFALFYQYAWSKDKGVRQVLALLPSYMIFDDHEIVNNWNIFPQWYAQTVLAGREQVLIDGLVAYWLYQGWGNILEREKAHPLLSIMQRAEQSGEDVLVALRDLIKQEAAGDIAIPWHYSIATTPPIFMTNVRSERTRPLKGEIDQPLQPTRIMGQGQMHELQAWLESNKSLPCLIASSVPVLLPPLIGLAEYGLGKRFWQQSIQPLRWLAARLARRQQKLAVQTSFDHWPVFGATWQEFLKHFQTSQKDILILSGDVHFSYSAVAQMRESSTQTKAQLYQFVSTPIQNTLSRRDYFLVSLLSQLKRLSYSNLDTRVLPLHMHKARSKKSSYFLFCNTLAHIQIDAQGKQGVYVQHEYLGLVNNKIEIIASTHLT